VEERTKLLQILLPALFSPGDGGSLSGGFGLQVSLPEPSSLLLLGTAWLA
jgi:hypothetical protein